MGSSRALCVSLATTQVAWTLLIAFVVLVRSASAADVVRPVFVRVNSINDCGPKSTTTEAECVIKSVKCAKEYGVQLNYFRSPCSKLVPKLGCQCLKQCSTLVQGHCPVTLNKPTARPAPQPTARPTQQPTARPTQHPTARPTNQPTTRPTNQPTARPTNQPTFLCFPGSSIVTTEDRGPVRISELMIGDSISAAAEGDFSPVYSKVLTFFHVKTNVTYDYIELTTASGAKISLSANHLIFVSSSEYSAPFDLPADQVRLGQYLWTRGEKGVSASLVSEITFKQDVGVYAPLTEHGTLVVNNIIASSFASGRHSEKQRFWSFFRLYRHFFPTREKHLPPQGWIRISKLSLALSQVSNWIEGKPVMSDWSWMWSIVGNSYEQI